MTSSNDFVAGVVVDVPFLIAFLLFRMTIGLPCSSTASSVDGSSSCIDNFSSNIRSSCCNVGSENTLVPRNSNVRTKTFSHILNGPITACMAKPIIIPL